MRIFISVVSHGHGELISSLDTLSSLNNNFIVVVKNNKKDDKLVNYTTSNNIKLINSQYGEGFGANNNIVFNFCREELGLQQDDLFVVLNPDLVITSDSLHKLQNYFLNKDLSIATVNLFKDEAFAEYDPSIRNFPSLLDFSSSILGLGNKTIIDKSKLEDNTFVDWSAGSFLAFRASHYFLLRGFDERYFMYCEDVDICQRSADLGRKVYFIKDIKCVHLAQHSNRNIFSKHFLWHLRNAVRYLFSKKIETEIKSKVRSL